MYFKVSRAIYESILDFFDSPEIQATTWLQLNRAKCRFTSAREYRARGAKVLGSWVGGPRNPTNDGARLAMKAVDSLRERLSLLDGLPRQGQLLLLC